MRIPDVMIGNSLVGRLLGRLRLRTEILDAFAAFLENPNDDRPAILIH